MKENARLLPLHRRRLRLQARGRGPDRMFAGEGDAFRTNRRFKRVRGMPAKRLSTAFDSVTSVRLRPGRAPGHLRQGRQLGRLDRHARRHEGAVDGFDLCNPTTSVSMTINGPAPIILACFFNTAIDQQIESSRPTTAASRPGTEAQKISRVDAGSNVRGTVQADILKEDQGQNTCIFSTEFALKMMGDIQEFFVHHRCRTSTRCRSPAITSPRLARTRSRQLAFTLANGFTYVEAYLARGMHIDDFAPNPVVLLQQRHGPRVLGDRPRRPPHLGGGDEEQVRRQRAQPEAEVPHPDFGRSLHAQEMDFNDIRTTLQALIAIYDNCNSLHTNAYDEAITTPTDESVRRAMAIQLVINREWGVSKNENPTRAPSSSTS